eukprot:GABW01000489.1.p2 GENE.GABW01000489.1~~GABW01000489.1.p2  ORF type:complete len:63 (-),score=1.97 GABW01000489.1:61-249(-)
MGTAAAGIGPGRRRHSLARDDSGARAGRMDQGVDLFSHIPEGCFAGRLSAPWPGIGLTTLPG